MRIVVIASGSAGNATYIETDGVKILIDAGVSYLQITSRLRHQNIELKELDAIIVTHEHTDHTKFLVSLLERTKANLYINEESYHALDPRISENLGNYPTFFIKEETRYKLKDLTFMPLQLSHDAVNTYGFVFESDGKTLGYITDTGIIPTKYLTLISRMNVLIIESNHDVEMLMNSNRHWSLKRRILSTQGHLSNKMCSEILKSVITDKTKYVVLAHISRECNTYELAYEYNNQQLKGPHTFELLVAKQDEELKAIEL
jgi:phosphoribosyl 1,2-cyclic phosphodiesterase